MAEQLEIQENKKRRGIKEVEKIDIIIKQLVEYADYCPDPDALDRLSDATKELRKVKLHLKRYYGIDD